MFLEKIRMLLEKEKKATDLPLPCLSATEVWDNVCDLPKFTNNNKACRIQGYGDTHNWTKRSIFWDLPYWKDNLLRHNLDVIQIEIFFRIMYLTQ